MFPDYYPLGYWYLAQVVLAAVAGMLFTWWLIRRLFSPGGRLVRLIVPVIAVLPLIWFEYDGNSQVGSPGSGKSHNDTFSVAGVHYLVLGMVVSIWMVAIILALFARRRARLTGKGFRQPQGDTRWEPPVGA